MECLVSLLQLTHTHTPRLSGDFLCILSFLVLPRCLLPCTFFYQPLSLRSSERERGVFLDSNKSKPVIWRVGAAPLLQEHSVAHSHNVGLHANSVVMKNASADIVCITIAGTKRVSGKDLKRYNCFSGKVIIVFTFPCFKITDYNIFRIILLFKKDKKSHCKKKKKTTKKKVSL